MNKGKYSKEGEEKEIKGKRKMEITKGKGQQGEDRERKR